MPHKSVVANIPDSEPIDTEGIGLRNAVIHLCDISFILVHSKPIILKLVLFIQYFIFFVCLSPPPPTS